MDLICTALWIVLDALSLAAGTAVAHLWTFGASTAWSHEEWTVIANGSALLLSFAVAGVYRRRHRLEPARALLPIAVTCALWLIVGDRAIFSTHIGNVVSIAWLDAGLVTAMMLMTAARLSCGKWVRAWHSSRSPVRRVVIAGDPAYLDAWMKKNAGDLENHAIIATVSCEEPSASASLGIPIVSCLDNLACMASEKRFDELWLALPVSEEAEIRCYLATLQCHFVNIRLFADAQAFPVFNPYATTIAGTTFIDLVTSPSYHRDAWLKLLFDRLFAAFALIALSPVLAAIALLVKLSSPGPVFFRQRRKGADGLEFTIFKFRSMRMHTEAAGTVTQARKNDSRMTRIGRALRKTSLDELPQFFNVLLGQMSVVGPRPHAIEHDDFYMRLIDGYMYRYRIKPGITGWAQVNGARGETPHVDCMARRVALDLFYIQNWSFWLDMKIVLKTVFKGFTGANAH